MGWGGSALGANQVLRNNRAMLKKRQNKRILSLVSEIDEHWETLKRLILTSLWKLERAYGENK